MTKAKIAFYIALIFVAGAVAGAGVRTFTPRPQAPQRPPRDPEAFANHIFNRIKERLELTPEQIEKVEPVFRRGFEEVRAIQDRSIKEVQAAVKRNHDEIGKLVEPAQRQKLEEMDFERDKAFRERRGRRHGPPGGDSFKDPSAEKKLDKAEPAPSK
jgi:hypothetical protein